MGVSQGNFAAGPAGLQLVAWALVNGATGAMVKGSGFASTSRGSVGSYTLTFTAARANTNYFVESSVNGSPTYPGWTFGAGAKAVGSFPFFTTDGSTFADPPHFHVAVYE